MSATTTNENIMNCMQNTFFERTDDIIKAKTFEEFYEIYKQELVSDMDRMLEISDKFNLYRARDTIYVTSLFFDGCIEKAMPYSKGTAKVTFGGPTVIGLANTIDSLSVVKQFVYDEKIVDMKTLSDALLNNHLGPSPDTSQCPKPVHFYILSEANLPSIHTTVLRKDY